MTSLLGFQNTNANLPLRLVSSSWEDSITSPRCAAHLLGPPSKSSGVLLSPKSPFSASQDENVTLLGKRCRVMFKHCHFIRSPQTSLIGSVQPICQEEMEGEFKQMALFIRLCYSLAWCPLLQLSQGREAMTQPLWFLTTSLINICAWILMLIVHWNSRTDGKVVNLAQ